jgi:hypothetical protein
MDTDTLVSGLVGDGQRLADELRQAGFPVAAAFWLKASEDGKWSFYIVSSIVDSEGLTKAYRRLHPLVRNRSVPVRIDPLEIKLIGPSNPIARDVAAILGRFSGTAQSPILWGGKQLGSVSIEDAYLYPLPTAP